MATFQELVDLYGTSDYDELRNKVKVAVVINASAKIDKTAPTVEEIAFATDAIDHPGQFAEDILNYLIGSNSGNSIATITSAGDSVIQNSVDNAIAKLYV